MKCPVCSDQILRWGERYGIEIDQCPRCRGIWLDRSELEQIVARSQGRWPTYLVRDEGDPAPASSGVGGYLPPPPAPIRRRRATFGQLLDGE